MSYLLLNKIHWCSDHLLVEKFDKVYFRLSSKLGSVFACQVLVCEDETFLCLFIYSYDFPEFWQEFEKSLKNRQVILFKNCNFIHNFLTGAEPGNTVVQLWIKNAVLFL